MMQKVGLAVGTALVGILCNCSAYGESFDRLTDELRQRVRGNMCTGDMRAIDPILNYDGCGDPQDVGVGNWYDCSNAIDKLNTAIGEWNALVRRCQAKEREENEKARSQREEWDRKRKEEQERLRSEVNPNTGDSSRDTAGDMVSVSPNLPGGQLSMRSGPGADNPVVSSIPSGTSGLRMLGMCAGGTGGEPAWCKVEWNGVEGWISTEGLTPPGRGDEQEQEEAQSEPEHEDPLAGYDCGTPMEEYNGLVCAFPEGMNQDSLPGRKVVDRTYSESCREIGGKAVAFRRMEDGRLADYKYWEKIVVRSCRRWISEGR